MGVVTPLRQRRRRRLPAMWRPYRARRGLSPAEIRTTVWAGLLLGLLLYQALRLWSGLPLLPPGLTAGAPGPEPVAAAPPDPYAEARRSRAILDAQEAPMTALAGDRADVGAGPAGPGRVIDGDTFDYRGMRIRIADIDTPEVQGRCPHEIQLAARATRRMRALLAAGPIELHALSSGRDEDRYGRKLRIVTRGGRSLGDVLVAEGLARTWSGRRGPWC